ncbi:hypothetical protein Scep_016560 [Stephania cephalantha]|uniref:Uncharacterized protein n=1 Tax=Stephania cephalantha TaxID=152367 RepID=A0AAP0IN20_9MAGN
MAMESAARVRRRVRRMKEALGVRGAPAGVRAERDAQRRRGSESTRDERDAERRDEGAQRGGSARANRVRFAFGGVGDRSGRSSDSRETRLIRWRGDRTRSTITVQGGAIGDSGVGKSNLLSRFTRNEFAWSPSPPSASIRHSHSPGVMEWYNVMAVKVSAQIDEIDSRVMRHHV